MNELEVLIRYHQQKAKVAQTNCEDMGRAVHVQAEAMARQVEEAEDELHRHHNQPLGFFRLFRFYQNLLRSIV
ncbi:hypothetical protein Fmac_032747 [Flemingia macrophylla]|uniref:Uncharacterized protein n=1 Tax=Flemingia macrophylla TaxID=520843 RepID=A0ABD1L5U4_9FABA